MAETITITLDTKAQTGGINTIISSLGQVQAKAKEAHGAFSKLTDILKDSAKEILAPLAAIFSIVKLAEFEKKTIETADALAKQAQKAGLSVEAFSALAATSKSAGVGAEELISASKGLGVWLEKSGQTGKNLNQVILEQADIFAKMPEGLDKVRLAQERFGRTGQELIPLLNQGSEAIREQIRENQEFGNVVGPRFAASATAFNDNLSRIKAIFQGMFNLLSDALLPELNKLLETFISWVKETGASRAIVETLIDLYKDFAVGISSVAYAFTSAGAAAGTFLGALYETGSFADAYDAMLEDADKRFEDFKKRAREIMAIGVKSDNGTSSDQGGDSKARFEADEKRHSMAMSLLDIEREQLQVRGAQFTLDSRDDTISRQRVGTLQQEADKIRAILEQKSLLNKQDLLAIQLAQRAGIIDQVEAQEKILANKKEELSIQKELQGLNEKTNNFGFLDKLSRNLDDIGDQFKHLGASIADTLTNGIKGAIDVVSKGIWQVIDGTATWGQLFRQVGRDIISSLIQIAIQDLLVHNIRMGLVAVYNAFAHAMGWAQVADHAVQKTVEVGQHATAETVKTGASWAGAIGRGVVWLWETVSHGVMVGIRTAAHVAGEIVMTGATLIQSGIRIAAVVAESIVTLIKAAFKAAASVADIPFVGPVLAIAAIAAVIAAGAAAMGAFEKGGVIGGGEQVIRVNERGTESVLNARATAMLGEGTINALNAGMMGAQGLQSRIAGGLSIPTSSGMSSMERGSQGGRGGQQINILMVDSRNAQAAKNFIESSGGQVVVAQAVRNQKTNIGIRG